MNAVDVYPVDIVYLPSQFKILVSVGTSVVLWDLLTGNLCDVFRNQCEKEITCLALLSNTGLYIVGSSDGTLTLRKTQSGCKVSLLHKHKSSQPVTHRLWKEWAHWGIAAFVDGLVLVLGGQGGLRGEGVKEGQGGQGVQGEWGVIRTLNVRKFFSDALLCTIEYE